MRVSVERLPGSAVSLEIYADDDEYKAAIDKTVAELRREVQIPGFRKGKAPRNILERMIGRAPIVAQTNQDLVEDLYKQAVEQEELVPVANPELEILQEEPLGFKVTVEVFPTADLGDYQSVRVESREVDVTDEEVDTVIEQVRKNAATWQAPEQPRRPADGDQVTLDIAVFEGDDAFMPASEDEKYVLGETPLFESIAEAIKMMQPGDTAELTLAFEEDDVTVGPELRGHTLAYRFTLKDVQERHLPELDDELAKNASEYDTLEEMTGRIRRDLLRAKATESRSAVMTEIIDAVAGGASLEIPGGLVDREIEDEVTATSSRFASQGLKYEDYLRAIDTTDEEYREGLREDATRRLRNSIVLQELAKAESLEVTDEEVDAEIERNVEGSPNPERRRMLFSSEYFRNQLKSELFDRKLTDRLIEIATEGRGAVTGPGADILAAGPEPPPPPRAMPTETIDVDGELVAEEVATPAVAATEAASVTDDAVEAPVDATEEPDIEVNADPVAASAASEPEA